MKKLCLFLVAFIACPVLGQYSNTVITHAAGAPAGACSYNRLYVNDTTGGLYNCKLGSWSLAGPGSTVLAHNILSLTHDAHAAAVVRGDIIVGRVAAPNTVWERLPKANQYIPLVGGVNEPEWTALALDQTTATSGILGSAKGGTANGFTKFTGPTTAEKTFTLPDASATILTTYDSTKVYTASVPISSAKLLGMLEVLVLSAVANAGGGVTVYTGTITNGAANALVGGWYVVAGFTDPNSNGTFICTASTALTITLANPAATAEVTAGTATNLGFQLIAAPAASKLINVLSVVLQSKDGGTPYTAGMGELFYVLNRDSVGSGPAIMTINQENLIDLGVDAIGFMARTIADDSAGPQTVCDAQSIIITASVAPTVGNGSLVAIMHYTIVDIP